jgi:ABC-type branched-subunit amino acid transport system substrate-binding protein
VIGRRPTGLAGVSRWQVAVLIAAIAVGALIGFGGAGWWSPQRSSDDAGDEAVEAEDDGVEDAAGQVGDRSTPEEPGAAADRDPSPGGAGSAGGVTERVESGLVDVDRLLAVDADCPDPATGEPVRIGVVTDEVAVAGADVEGAGVEGAGVERAGVEGGDPAVDARPDHLPVAAARHLAALVTCSGGVDGRPVEVVTVAAGGSALATRRATAGLLAEDPVVVIGPSSVDLGLRLVEAVDGRVPVLFPLAVEPALDDPARQAHLLGPDGSALAAAAARYALDRGWSSAAVFSDAAPWTLLVADTFTSVFERAGGVVVVDLAVVEGDDGAVDLAGQLDRLGLTGGPRLPPDVIVVAVDPFRLGPLVVALTEAGATLPVVAVDGRRPFPGTSPPNGVTTVGRPPDETETRADWFDQSYREVAGQGFEDPVAAARVADGIVVALEAMARMGLADPGAIGPELDGSWWVTGLAGPAGVWTGPGPWPGWDVPVVTSEDDRTTLDGTVTVPSG